MRIPFTKWPFLDGELDDVVAGHLLDGEPRTARASRCRRASNRRFFDLQARITGPVFNRIFDKPNSSYATKFKHVIEPTVVIQRVTAIDVFDQIVRIDGADTIVGGTTRVTYGLNNRLYAKKQTAREIVSLGITQSYYSNSTASQFDPNYQSSYNAAVAPKNFRRCRDPVPRGSDDTGSTSISPPSTSPPCLDALTRTSRLHRRAPRLEPQRSRRSSRRSTFGIRRGRVLRVQVGGRTTASSACPAHGVSGADVVTSTATVAVMPEAEEVEVECCPKYSQAQAGRVCT